MMGITRLAVKADGITAIVPLYTIPNGLSLRTVISRVISHRGRVPAPITSARRFSTARDSEADQVPSLTGCKRP